MDPIRKSQEWLAENGSAQFPPERRKQWLMWKVQMPWYKRMFIASVSLLAIIFSLGILAFVLLLFWAAIFG